MRKLKSIILFIFLGIGLSSLSSCANKKSVELKIMSYNIRHGEGLDSILDLSRAADIIKSVGPDLCGIQEVDHYCLRTDSVGQTEYLAQRTAMKGTFGKFMDFQKGEYGMATLTSKPLIATKILQLPDGKYEPRSSIIHEVEIEKGCTIVFANVHFEWINGQEGIENRLKQAKTLVDYVDSLSLPVVITGDFNCRPDSPTMKYFASEGFVFVDKGKDHLSFQGNKKAEIDHLIFRDFGKVKFSKKAAALLEEPLVSDHRPLVVELTVTYKFWKTFKLSPDVQSLVGNKKQHLQKYSLKKVEQITDLYAYAALQKRACISIF